MRGARTRHAKEDKEEPPEFEPQPLEDGAGSSWKQEMESIMAGTHPTLVAELKKHEMIMQAQVAQAERIQKLQTANIDNLYDCDKKQIDDEYQAQLEFYQQRLVDSLERKQQKNSRPGRQPAESAQPAAKRTKLGRSTVLDDNYVLKADELKNDVDEILRNVDHYSVRSAALASDDLRSSGGGDAWFDRSRQLLHCNSHALERGAAVYVHQQGQRVDGQWTITAMNAVEVTLRDSDGTKLKVTLSQLRNNRYVLRPA